MNKRVLLPAEAAGSAPHASARSAHSATGSCLSTEAAPKVRTRSAAKRERRASVPTSRTAANVSVRSAVPSPSRRSRRARKLRRDRGIFPLSGHHRRDVGENDLTDLTGAFRVSREVSRSMISEKSGRIVNVSSMWGEGRRIVRGTLQRRQGGADRHDEGSRKGACAVGDHGKLRLPRRDRHRDELFPFRRYSRRDSGGNAARQARKTRGGRRRPSYFSHRTVRRSSRDRISA